MKIESTDQDVRTLLSSSYYRIPRFQRPYSWDRENVQEFWDDIVRDNPADYFIGSMVVYKDGQQRYGVVDGQQRLTTITILLCVLRNTLASRGLRDLAEGVHGLVERRNIDNIPEFIVSTESSYPYFQLQIQQWTESAGAVQPLSEEVKLKAAYDQLEELVESALQSVDWDTTLSPEKKDESVKLKLVAIRDVILNLKVIFIKLEDEDDAYVIFETLNTRGKDLSLTDLVKNHLTKHIRAKNPASDEAKVKWRQLLEAIEGSAVELETDTFIHHFWLSRYDYLPAKKLFKVLKKRVGIEQAPELLSALLEDSSTYRKIHEISYGNWSKDEARIVKALDALTLFRVQQQTPCALSLLREYRTTGKLKKRHLEEALVAIEKFHFLFTAITSQRSSGGISAMYAALGRRLFEAMDTQAAVEVIRDMKAKLRDRVPSEDEFRALFPKVILTDNVTRQRRLAKYILERLDQAVPSPLPIDYEHMTVEHIAPQSWIGQSGYDDTIIGQLGNLLLVSEELNKKLKAKTFKEKKAILVDSGYPVPEAIMASSAWGQSEIAGRTLTFAERAYNEVWRL